MTSSPYASDAKIAEALAVIGEDYVASTEQQLLIQIAVALGNRNATGGDPMTNTLTALGTGVTSLAQTQQGLLSQILVLAATA